MKTIEDAVIRFNGLWQECFDVGFSPLGITRQEFEACAKRMANKPSWDDAPENANYLIQDSRGRWNWCVDVQLNSPSGTVMVGVNPAGVGHLFGDNKDTLESRPSKKSPLNKNERCSMGEKESNWHSRGELPPVGELCEFGIASSKEYSKCTFVGINSNKNFVIEVYGKYSTYHESQIELRPIKSHREKVIESAIMVCTGVNIPTSTDGLTMKTLKKLYDAGMLVLPGTNCNTKD